MLDVLDTAGEEEYSTVQRQYMRASHGFLLVYSITRRQSFDELARYVEQIQRAKEVEYFPGVLIGNKIDLETERQVSFEEGQQLAERLELAFFETSAKSNIHVHEVRVSLSLTLSQSRCVCRSLSRSRHSHMKSALTIMDNAFGTGVLPSDRGDREKDARHCQHEQEASQEAMSCAIGRLETDR